MPQNVGRSPATVGYRIRQGNVIGLVAIPYQSSLIADGDIRVVYDDGTEDDLNFDPNPTTTLGTAFVAITKQAAKDGWIVGGTVGLRALTGTTGRSVRGYGQLLIISDVNLSRTISCIGQGFTGAFQLISVGQFQDNDFNATWVFQGTVAEDATGGTHICSLTVTPGAGNELELLYGQIIVGNTATAQAAFGDIADGTNNIIRFLNPEGVTGTTALLRYPIPATVTDGITTNDVSAVAGPRLIVSGTMTLVLTISTTAVSVTQTFSVACRIKGAPPTAVLADSVGTPVLTTNTSTVFG